MKTFTINLWEKDEYTYNTFTDFIPTLTCYVQGTKNKKPSILVVPGGGYNSTSPSEAEVVALKFIQKGYNAFVLTYSVKGAEKIEPVRMEALKDISKAMVTIKENASIWNVDTENISAIGFSAGGHLVASLGVHHNKPFLNEIKKGYDICPKAILLSYPVISTTEDFTHMGSKNCLLGENATKEEIEFMSLEKQISKDTPKTFLWHCMDDMSVNYENSIAFAKGLSKFDIPFEMHIFPYGAHGISTADELWKASSYDLYYDTLQLNRKLVEREIKHRDGLFKIKEGLSMDNINSYDDYVLALEKTRTYEKVGTKEYNHISRWVELALEWLEL